MTAPAARADAVTAVTAKTVSNPGADTDGPPQTRGAGPTPTRTSSTTGAETTSEPSSSSSGPAAARRGPPGDDEPRNDTNDAALNDDDAAPHGIGAAMASGVVDAARCTCSGLAAAALRVVCCLNKRSSDEEGCDSDDASSSNDKPTSSASKAGTPRLFYFSGDVRLLGGTRDQAMAAPVAVNEGDELPSARPPRRAAAGRVDYGENSSADEADLEDRMETEAEPTGLHDSEQKMHSNLKWPASMASMASS